jgi:CysZ protein
MSPLSEKIEARISNSSFQQDFSLKRILHEALRGVRIALRNIVREIFYSLILLILSFVPVVGIITAPALFMVQAYYAGFGNMDYYLERHFNVQGSAAFVRRYKGLAIGNGAIFLLLLMIPILGLFVAPVLATISSTVESHKRIADWD